jgi:hypothetical protein
MRERGPNAETEAPSDPLGAALRAVALACDGLAEIGRAELLAMLQGVVPDLTEEQLARYLRGQVVLASASGSYRVADLIAITDQGSQTASPGEEDV